MIRLRLRLNHFSDDVKLQWILMYEYRMTNDYQITLPCDDVLGNVEDFMAGLVGLVSAIGKEVKQIDMNGYDINY